MTTPPLSSPGHEHGHDHGQGDDHEHAHSHSHGEPWSVDVTQPHWADDVSVPAMLGAARRGYGNAIRAALGVAGFDDMPARGSFVIGAIRNEGFQGMDRMARTMGVSKQAVSQLVDTLVARGYLDRVPDAEDRRRMTITLTSRGEAASDEIREAVQSVNDAASAVVGPEAFAQARRVVAVLAVLAERGHEHPE